MIIRDMREEDLERVGELYAALYNYHRRLMGDNVVYSKEWGIKELKSVGGLVLVAEVDGSIAGFARIKEEEGVYFLKEIYVSPEFRGRGIGRALLRACEERAGSRIYASVIPANLPALDFFIREGYSFLNTVELTKVKGDVLTPVLGRVFEAVTPAGFKLKEVRYEVLDGDFCVSICEDMPSEFLTVVKEEKITVVSEGRPKCRTIESECGYRIIRFFDLPLEMVGLMAVISNALASEGVSLLAISSYSSDLILVKEESLAKALRALERVPYLVRSTAPL